MSDSLNQILNKEELEELEFKILPVNCFDQRKKKHIFFKISPPKAVKWGVESLRSSLHHFSLKSLVCVCYKCVTLSIVNILKIVKQLFNNVLKEFKREV